MFIVTNKSEKQTRNNGRHFGKKNFLDFDFLFIYGSVDALPEAKDLT